MAYVSKQNLLTHMKLTHKRKLTVAQLKDVLKEVGKEFVYVKSIDWRGRPQTSAVGIADSVTSKL